jgi:hypothetical protein
VVDVGAVEDGPEPKLRLWPSQDESMHLCEALEATEALLRRCVSAGCMQVDDEGGWSIGR